MAVVCDLDELETAVFDGQLDGGRSGVERVFDELFDRVGWAVDDLSAARTSVGGLVAMVGERDLGRRDVVHYILRELPDGLRTRRLVTLTRTGLIQVHTVRHHILVCLGVVER